MLLGIAFVGVQGDLNLVRMGADNLLPSGKQGAIGGEHGHEILLTGQPDELGQMGMQEGLSHQMEVQELDLSAELVGQEVELLQGKAMLGPIRLGTELAIEVAHIGYFKIASGNHRNGMDIKKISNRKTTADFCDPLGARTQDPNIKSVVLYLLS